jgi:hypothetical protein
VLAQPAVKGDAFAEAREGFAAIETFLGSKEACSLRESDLERELEKRGRELMRQLLEAHIQVRGPGEAAAPVQGSDGEERVQQRLHERGLETVFGEVRIERAGYLAQGKDGLHPMDADLNLPKELYSHELRRRTAWAAAGNSFDEVIGLLRETTGARVGKRQVEQLVIRAAEDFDAFYKEGYEFRQPEQTGPILVVTVDGKGVVMRHEDLREATQKKAETTQHKLTSRLSRGEKRNSKRMATVAAVYTIQPYSRTAEDILGCLAPHHEREGSGRPRPENKRVWASLEKPPEDIIKEAFREGRRRDPEGHKRWIALVDGNETQLDILRKRFHKEGYYPWIILDFIHVAERVWKAGLDFHPEGTSELEAWVSKRLLAILKGRAAHVAAGMRRSATRHGRDEQARQRTDSCADYLLKYKKNMQYDKYLNMGLPIATGVIEGACRYLVKDRLDRTGARWSLTGAEAVLRLRALRTSGDFDAYWRFHEEQEYRRNHVALYADGQVPPIRSPAKTYLKRVK